MQYLKAPIVKPISFVSAGHFISEGPWIHGKRCINTFEIILGVSGSAYIQQDEEKYVVTPGSTLLLLPDHVHRGYAHSEQPVSFYWLHFQVGDGCSTVDEKTAELEIEMSRNNPYFGGLSEYVLLPAFTAEKASERVNILFHQLLHISYSRYYTKLGADYLLTSLLIELSEQVISSARLPRNQKTSTRSLATILEWIRVHMRENISADDIARQFGCNKDYLSRNFKKKMGMHLQEYIHILKISKAKELLYQSEKSIKEIAYLLGFQDEKYFMRIFKRYEQMSPTRFRNAYYLTHRNRV